MKRGSFHKGLRGFWWLTLGFLYLPLIVVMLFSFNASNSAASFTGAVGAIICTCITAIP